MPLLCHPRWPPHSHPPMAVPGGRAGTDPRDRTARRGGEVGWGLSLHWPACPQTPRAAGAAPWPRRGWMDHDTFF